MASSIATLNPTVRSAIHSGSNFVHDAAHIVGNVVIVAGAFFSALTILLGSLDIIIDCTFEAETFEIAAVAFRALGLGLLFKGLAITAGRVSDLTNP
ncbi:MAG: hypothetical protein SP1CHLAM54_05140 [Chlamydiia bacterium]|nr:hypothetical protein [Chlamydiia bacterium]MCH9615426.1 hypothetical protein [Chlamydiia bacterium]MCH9628252.1 hypothetical protein [Chlamydiia bacterium]